MGGKFCPEGKFGEFGWFLAVLPFLWRGFMRLALASRFTMNHSNACGCVLYLGASLNLRSTVMSVTRAKPQR